MESLSFNSRTDGAQRRAGKRHCANHGDVLASGTCRRCQEAICDDCLFVDEDDQIICPICRATNPPLASLGQRFLARWLDGTIYAFIALILYVGLSSEAPGISWTGVGLALIVVGYNLWRLATHGQTLGKQGARVQIASAEGIPAPIWRLVVRWLPFVVLSWIPVVGIAVWPINILFGLRNNRKCLHDELAKTWVVATKEWSEASVANRYRA